MDKYVIESDTTARLVVVKPIGFFTADVFDAYRRDILAGVAKVGSPFDLLVDMSERVLQATDTTASYDKLTAELVARGMRRLVIAGSSPLLSVQVKRLTTASPPCFVESVEEGPQWLRDAA